MALTGSNPISNPGSNTSIVILVVILVVIPWLSLVPGSLICVSACEIASEMCVCVHLLVCLCDRVVCMHVRCRMQVHEVHEVHEKLENTTPVRERGRVRGRGRERFIANCFP